MAVRLAEGANLQADELPKAFTRGEHTCCSEREAAAQSVIFFEQLRLRSSIPGWFFVLDNQEDPNSVLPASKGGRRRGDIDDMKERVMELEKECQSIREEFQKL